jgi:hypothetical protein
MMYFHGRIFLKAFLKLKNEVLTMDDGHIEYDHECGSDHHFPSNCTPFLPWPHPQQQSLPPPRQHHPQSQSFDIFRPGSVPMLIEQR